mmetsp:Transcript_38001/g.122949  ORF Transcript_38001/g.122949 Transcript_38001/m.122949 type:complete len:220 (-) Transcript_38001:433-1092(-)
MQEELRDHWPHRDASCSTQIWRCPVATPTLSTCRNRTARTTTYWRHYGGRSAPPTSLRASSCTRGAPTGWSRRAACAPRVSRPRSDCVAMGAARRRRWAAAASRSPRRRARRRACPRRPSRACSCGGTACASGAPSARRRRARAASRGHKTSRQSTRTGRARRRPPCHRRRTSPPTSPRAPPAAALAGCAPRSRRTPRSRRWSTTASASLHGRRARASL